MPAGLPNVPVALPDEPLFHPNAPAVLSDPLKVHPNEPLAPMGGLTKWEVWYRMEVSLQSGRFLAFQAFWLFSAFPIQPISAFPKFLTASVSEATG